MVGPDGGRAGWTRDPRWSDPDVASVRSARQRRRAIARSAGRPARARVRDLRHLRPRKGAAGGRRRSHAEPRDHERGLPNRPQRTEPRDFRGMSFDEAEMYAKREGVRAAEGHVQDAIDEVGHALKPVVVTGQARRGLVQAPATAWSKDMDGRIGIGRVAGQGPVLAVHFQGFVAAGLHAPRDIERREKVPKVEVEVHGVSDFRAKAPPGGRTIANAMLAHHSPGHSAHPQGGTEETREGRERIHPHIHQRSTSRRVIPHMVQGEIVPDGRSQELRACERRATDRPLTQQLPPALRGRQQQYDRGTGEFDVMRACRFNELRGIVHGLRQRFLSIHVSASL